jgi:hypothetical protein
LKSGQQFAGFILPQTLICLLPAYLIFNSPQKALFLTTGRIASGDCLPLPP